MSTMFSKTRKPLEPSTNGNNLEEPLSNSSILHSSNGLTTTTTTSTTTTTTIPPNKGGKRYSMNEVFQVWYDKKDQILEPSMELPVQQNENYKLSKPNQIYHLDLQSFVRSNYKENGESYDQVTNEIPQVVSNSLENLNINDDNVISSTLPDSVSLVGGNQINAPPPGISQPVINQDIPLQSLTPPLLTSDKIEWYYIDPHGTEQGPFNGDMMQEWLSGGYLHLDLQIRRKEDTTFKTVQQLCDGVQNYVQPFKVPLPDLTVPPPPVPTNQFSSFVQQPPPFQKQQSQLHQFLAGSSRLNNSINPQSSLFGNDFINNDPFGTASPLNAPGSIGFQNTTSTNQFGLDTLNHHGFNNPLQSMPSLLQHQIQQQNSQPTLSRNNSGWAAGLDTSGGFGNSNPSTPVSNTLPQISQPAPISPWLSGIQSSSRVSSPFVSSSNINAAVEVQNQIPNNDDHVLDEIHTSVVTGILNEGEEDHFGANSAPAVETAPVAQVEVQQPAVVSNEPEQKQDSEPQPVAEQVEEATRYELKGAPVKKQGSEKERSTPKEVIVGDASKNTTAAPAPRPELAPWAAKKDNSKPSLTLKEIQSIEAERSEKQKAQQKLEQQVAAAKAWAALDEQVVEKVTTALPKTSSWASATTGNSPVVTKKTLAEIQKEEAEAAAASKLANRSSVQKNSFASAISSTPIKEDTGVWTTVASKRTVVKKPVQQTITNSAAASKASPQLLRSVSATRPVTNSVNDVALKEEFLIWARSQMTNLYPTVSKDDLLDIFVTLPTSSSDSSQLIADTIYSSSATMDGRRFAQEFLKRRQKVDQQVSNDEDSWSAAIISSADKVSTVDEDGWSTTVKSKKKSNSKKF
ncbi:uncharacterized protein RJT21DRAFT_30380 [Scheffersomyces amazonensis]|uniref:uncharacterized protein n=1 Tax=Scheffersomyces amazonensis TaxID=1078765 RepID=UPI00315D3A13